MVYRTEHMAYMKPTRKASPQVSTAQLSIEPGTGFQSLISIFRDHVKDKAPHLGTGYGVRCLAIPCCLAFTFVNLCPNGVSVVAIFLHGFICTELGLGHWAHHGRGVSGMPLCV